MTCAKAVALLATDKCQWQVRPAGAGSKEQRWYAWAWTAAGSRHYLLVRRHLTSGELAFHYRYVPPGQPLTLARLVRAAGLRCPVEEAFEFSKDSFGLDQFQARLHTAIGRHAVLVMTALAICAIAAGRLKNRTDTQAAPPNTPDQRPQAEPGMVPLTIPETARLLTATWQQPNPADHDTHWRNWQRRHQARARWFYQRTRLNREYSLAS